MRGATAMVAAAIAVAPGLIACRDQATGDVGVRRTRTAAASATAVRSVPRLVDLGAGKCIPCKAMAPILEQLRTDFAGRLEVTFIDVWQMPDQARSYRINMIPTQIFFDGDGRELGRHEGFMSREQILAHWKALGVEL